MFREEYAFAALEFAEEICESMDNIFIPHVMSRVKEVFKLTIDEEYYVRENLVLFIENM